MFKVECVGCQAPYQVDERRVPDKGLKMRCPKCGTTFKVEPPAAGTAPSQAPAAEIEQPPSSPKVQPFASAGLDLGAKLNKPPTARDSLARTMIGVSSGDLDAASKDAAADASKSKAFRIPRPAGAAEPPRVRAPVTEPLLAEEVGLPATPARPRAFGLTARGAADSDAELPRVVPDVKRAQAAPGATSATGAVRATAPEEVQHILPSAAPTAEASWLSGSEASDAHAAAIGGSVAPTGSVAPGGERTRPAMTAPIATPANVPLDAGISLEFEPHDNLPAVVSPAKRPPPRRPRPATETPADPNGESALIPDDEHAGLPAVVAAPPRPLDRAPRPPARPKPAAPTPSRDLDLPAVARPAPPPAPPRAPSPPAPARTAVTVADLPSARPAARPAAQPAPPDTGLPAVGRGVPSAGQPRPAPTHADLPSVLGGPGLSEPSPELPAVLASGLPEVDLPDVPLEPLPGFESGRAELPAVLATGLPAVSAPGFPAKLGSPALSSAGLPAISAGLPEVLAGGLPAVSASGLPAVSAAGLPDVLAAGLPDVLAGGLPAVSAAGLPVASRAGLPDVLAAGLPAVSSTGLPAVSSAGLPAVSPVGLPDVLAAGLPTVTAPGLPEILAPGVPGFGRVDLPVPRPAELPDVRSGALGLDTLDLPGVGESLPSVPESWGEANLPLVGESLPTVRGSRSIADVESPFGAFEPGAEGDPFAGSEADFGAPDGDDPFGAPASAGAEFAPMQGLDGASAAPQGHDGSGAGYGEVDIGAAEGDPASLETAEDMEFRAIPERSSAGPARAAASASVHAEAPDTEAAGSTLELGPERKAPKARARRLAMLAAVCLGAIGGGALALKPAIGPFGIHFVMDQIKRGERERLLGKLVSDAHEAQRRDTLGALREVLRGLEKARAEAPRFAPLAARSAFEHYAAVLRYGPLPDLEATAKVAIDQLDGEDDEAGVLLARAAQAAATRGADAKKQLEALGADGDARALLGELSLAEQDWAGASNVWAGLAKSDPQSARAAFALARIELGQGRYQEASNAAQRVLALNPEHIGAPILILEAQRALRATNPSAAESTPTEQLAATVTQKLAAAAPAEAALAHCVLGELHASQGRTLPALQQFEAALVIDRTLPRALIGLGEVLHQSARFSEALARFEAAAKAQPSSLSAQLGIAKSQLQLAHLNEAKALLGRLPEADKARPETIFWTAKTEQALGNADAALSGYRAAIAAGKGRADSVEAYLALAKLQAELGQLAAAQDTLSEARTKLPPSGALYKALGEIAITRADYAAAYEHAQKALELDGGDTRARFLAAVALTRLGRFEEALQAFQTVGQTDKDFPGLAVERGRLFEVSGRNAEALVEYEAALKKSPDDPDVQTRVGCARVVAGQAAAAQSLLESALKQRPRSAEASYCMGRALFDQGRLPDALTRLERAIDVDPSRAVYHLYSGWVATEMGRQGAAREALDRAIELDKGLGDAYWLRGRLLLKQGAAKDAIVDLERATKLAPQRQDALADLAVAYADTARAPKALELWEQALARDPDNATWHFRYGKLLSSYGNGAMAAAHLGRALDIVREAEGAAPAGDKPKPPLWIWQAHYLLARELGMVAAAVPHWQAYLRSSPRDDPYRSEAERALRELGQPWDPR